MPMSSPRLRLSALLVTVLAACGGQQHGTTVGGSPAPATPSISVTDGESLIRAMHARYAGRWSRTITFTQTVSLLGDNGPNSDQLWYVAIAPPGRQRIDYANPDLGNGLLVRADSAYFFANGRQVRTATGWNDQLLLTQDVYLQSPEVTISILRSLGYQLSRLRSSSFDGKTAYAVGAAGITDSISKQFWVERDRMVLVRIRERTADGQYADTRLGDFVKAGDGWIAKQTYRLQNGIPRLHQQVAGVRADMALDSALFDPRQWSTVKHWSKP